MAILCPTILVIDDDTDVRETVSMLLELELGHCTQIVAAPDGARALTLALSTHPDLIVCDCSMPAMNGPTFVGRARREPALSDVPILMLSGEPALSELMRGLDVQALVNKTDIVEQLVDVARRLLASTLGKAVA
jgi:CheY-like chemotaxis protein